jgi:Ino eighty subunit 1
MTDQDGGRSPGSTIEASEIDEHVAALSPVREPDPRTSLKHVLGDTISHRNTPTSNKRTNGDMTEDEEPNTPATITKSTGKGGKGRGKGGAAQAAASSSTAHSGSKVKHLKKDDGEPLWRKDIQYDFLKFIFDDTRKCFTNSYEPENIGKQTFADLYIDAMARSSKTSKILRDKLLSEHEPAKNMAMVCLLVNLGRMNTTLNCQSLFSLILSTLVLITLVTLSL